MLASVCLAGLVMKQIKTILPTPRNHWVGDGKHIMFSLVHSKIIFFRLLQGFYVKPVFNELAFTNEISPFLMFDYAAPKMFEPTRSRLGVGVHPHRGFETVTIAFQGKFVDRNPLSFLLITRYKCSVHDHYNTQAVL